MKRKLQAAAGRLLGGRRRAGIIAIFLVPLCLAAAVLTVALTLRSAQAAPSDAWDLNNFVTGVTVKDSEGRPVTDGKFFYGDVYTFNIVFAERTGANGQFAYNGVQRLLYKLPSSLVMQAPVNAGAIRVESTGATVGWYNIDAGGNVEVWFGSFDKDGNPAALNFIDGYTDVQFTLEIFASFSQGAGTGQILFGGEGSITIGAITSPPPGLSVTKTAAAFDAEREAVDFEIVITAERGSVKEIKLSDVLSVDRQSWTLKQSDSLAYFLTGAGNGFFQYKFGGGSWITMASVPWASGGNSLLFDFTGNGPLASGQTITIKYTVYLSAFLDKYADLGYIAYRYNYGSASGSSMNLVNDAAATGKDNAKDTPLEAAARTTTPLARRALTKSGATTTSAGEQAIRWTVSWGSDRNLRLNGLTLADRPGPNQQIIGGSIEVRVAGKSGSLSPALSTEVAASCITPANPTGSFSFTVPAGGFAGYTDVYYIQIAYNAAPSGGYGVIYTNEVEFFHRGYRSWADASVNNVSPGVRNISVTKDSEWAAAAGTAVNEIKYTVVVTVPAGAKDGQFYLIDYLRTSATADISSAATGTLAYNRITTPEAKLTVTLDPPEPESTKLLYYIPAQSDSSTSWTMYFGGGTSSGTTKWQYDEPKTVTITYCIPLDAWAERSGSTVTKTIRNVLESKGTLNNAVYAYYNISGSSWTTPSPGGSDGTIDYFPIYKEGKVSAASGSVFDYKVALNWRPNGNATGPSSGPLTDYTIFQANLPALYRDDFDQRLEYVPGSMYLVEYEFTSASPRVWREKAYYGPYNAAGSEAVTSGNGWFELNFANFRQFSTPFSGNPKSAPLLAAVQNTGWYTQSTRYELRYQLQLKKPEYGQFVLPNTATLSANTPGLPNYGGKTNGWKSSCDVPYNSSVVSKSMRTQDGGSVIPVEIIVNPSGRKLLPEGMPDDRLYAIDKMTGDLSFYLSTVRLFTQTKVGGVWDGNWIPLPVSPTPGALWSVRSIDSSSFEIILKDETPIMIQYDARVTAEIGASASFRNEISVYNYKDIYEEDHYKVERTGATASANSAPLTVFKVDKNDPAKRLQGAEFKLYMAVPGPGGSPAGGGYYGTGTPTAHLPVGTPPNAVNFYQVNGTAATDVNGEAVFGSTWLTPTHNAVYLLAETKAPNGGYPLPAAPDSYTFIALRSLTPAERTAWEAALGKPIQVIADNIFIENEGVPANAVVKGTKTVTGEAVGSKTFTFRITRVTNASGTTDVTGADAYTAATTAAVSGNGTQGFTFQINDLPRPATGSSILYYYKVAEAPDSPTALYWTYSANVYLATVSVPAGTADPTVTYTRLSGANDHGTVNNAPNGPVEFINRFWRPRADAVINGRKTIKSLAPIDRSFTFNIARVTTVAGSAVYTGEGALNQDFERPRGDWAYTVAGLVPGTYYYKITEKADVPPADGWYYSGAGYVITVKVNEDGTVGYTNNSAAANEFINTYEPAGAIFPGVGGPGTRPYAMAFFILASVLSMSLVGALIYNYYGRRRWFNRLE